MITLTETACDKINKMVGLPILGVPAKGLRIKVMGGGCSGLTYKMDLDFPNFEKDKTFTHNEYGGLLIVDKKSFLYLNGMVLDYNEGLMKSGFEIRNPNVKHTCGCGESFTI